MTTPARIVVVGVRGTLGSRIAEDLPAAVGVDFRATGGAELDASIASSIGAADVVINAGGPRVRLGLDAVAYQREHVGVAAHVVRSMRRGAHLIHISSTAVYGARDAICGDATPEDPARFPMAAYAFAKLAAESLARAEGTARGLAVSVLRPSMVYGPRVESALATLAKLAARGIHLRLLPRRGRQHLLHIDLLLAAIRSLLDDARPGAPLVLADPFVLTNADLATTSRLALPIPVDLSHALQARWTRRLPLRCPSALETLAVLGLDNEFDSARTFARLGLDAPRFSREETFAPYWTACGAKRH